MAFDTFSRAQPDLKIVQYVPVDPKRHSKRPPKILSSAKKDSVESPTILMNEDYRHNLEVGGGGSESDNVSNNNCRERSLMAVSPEDQYLRPPGLSQSCSQGEHSAHM
jgi:hypothetical protein